MISHIFKVITLLLFSTAISAQAAADKRIQPDVLYPRVKFETSLGDFTVELNRRRAPITVDNFLTYVVKGEFDGVIFHRVIGDFMAQTGGYDKNFQEKPKRDSIVNESGNGLKNDEGTIAMARMNDPHSAARQFFFNLNDNDHLNPGRNWGYTVFGEIDSNSEILEKFKQLETEFNPKLGQPDVPKQIVLIKRVTLLPQS
ncbi:peptidylprolyl isomerase [Saccharobesus litoralis]|uniref:Peptidyl-prolyl cis-trans isomerase n=1 Tax=Saccharobesus litoralis TaxID=2172099 RepID=A0A2S0VXY9_9ALTE|nr:peptidylprolyl isomerase [Saccharobesus litoralis]AWB69063.1 peptidylprolyl isomerase [Saccharobesus litoralis]